MSKIEEFFKTYADTDDQLNFRMANETLGDILPAISTGSLLLDDILGSGGLPKGRLIQYYGAAGSGKTLLAMIAMLHAQKEDPEASQLFADAEGTFDPTWAEKLGLDTTRIILVQDEMAVLGRNLFEMLLGVPKEDKKTHELIGKSKQGLLDQIACGELNINMIVVDSLGAIMPPGEDTSVVGKQNMALMARFLTTTFRKLSLEVKKANIPFVVINHKKANMDPYGVDHSYSGGNTYTHFLSANLYFEAVQRADARILDDKENKIGHMVRCTIEKSKFAPWPRKCEFKVNFGIGIIDRHEEIVKLATEYDIIKKLSSVSYEYDDQKYVGLGKLNDAVAASPELANKLEEAIKARRVANHQVQKAEQDALKIAALAKVEKKSKKKDLT